MSKPGVEITREEFYELLWSAPLKALVEKFGTDYNDLVGLAEKHRLPRPAKGYWTKRAAGAPSSRPPLPENPRSGTNSVFIPCRKAEQDKRSAELAKYDALVGKIDLPKDLKRAHPLVIRWIEERQRCSRAISKTSRHSEIYFEQNETDIRRHRLLDALIQFLEKLGGKIEADHDEKWIVVWLGAARISFRVRELLKEAWLPLSEEEKKSYGGVGKTHRTMLNGSGIVTLHISGTFERTETSWSDAPGNPVERHLRQIAATFLIARDHIIQRQQEEAAYRRRMSEQQAIRRAEAERRQREDNRWACLVDLSKRADEVESTRRFLERLERCGLPDDHQAGDRTVAEWMTWAREQIRERDPLSNGAGAALDRLAAI